jgi:hypothetical protein
VLEKAGRLEEASEIFDKCFSNLDGRADDIKSSRSGMSSISR